MKCPGPRTCMKLAAAFVLFLAYALVLVSLTESVIFVAVSSLFVCLAVSLRLCLRLRRCVHICCRPLDAAEQALMSEKDDWFSGMGKFPNLGKSRCDMFSATALVAHPS